MVAQSTLVTPRKLSFEFAIAGLWVAMAVSALSPVFAAEGFAVRAVSSRPDAVSGGNALVALTVPDGLRWTVHLNGTDVTQSFQPDENSGNPMALLTELRIGNNLLTLRVDGKNRGKLELINHPLTGPIFSGPHQQPFV